MSMGQKRKRPVPAKLFQEVLETVAEAAVEASEVRPAELLRCYAELQFRINGSANCSICNATVRHKIPVKAIRPDGRIDQYDCLCTRCYEGERAQSTLITMQIGQAKVEQTPREDNRSAANKAS
jgi:hypothetical protein